METMLDGLLKLLRGSSDRLSTASDKELAYAVILVDIALVDQGFQLSEHLYIAEKLKEKFGLTLDQTCGLIEQARDIVMRGGEADAYARFLRKNLGPKQREELVKMVDQLLKIDAESLHFETQLHSRYERLLGVHTKNDSPKTE